MARLLCPGPVSVRANRRVEESAAYLPLAVEAVRLLQTRTVDGRLWHAHANRERRAMTTATLPVHRCFGSRVELDRKGRSTREARRRPQRLKLVANGAVDRNITCGIGLAALGGAGWTVCGPEGRSFRAISEWGPSRRPSDADVDTSRLWKSTALSLRALRATVDVGGRLPVTCTDLLRSSRKVDSSRAVGR